MSVYARNAIMESSKSFIMKDNDTNVVVIAFSALPLLHKLGLLRLWTAFEQGPQARWIPIHELVLAIGLKKASAILFFHVFTRFDVVSDFSKKGKKSAWLTWDVYEKVSDAFVKLNNFPYEVSSEALKVPENFIVLMYDRSTCSH